MVALQHAMPHTPSSVSVRLVAGAILIVCLSGLGLGLWMTPDDAGLGTHRQLGLQACQWHQTRGSSCPTCGVTTAFTLTTQGHLWQGWTTQPFGAWLALLLAMSAWIAGYALWTGVSHGRWLRPLCWPVVGGSLCLLIGGWAWRLYAMG